MILLSESKLARLFREYGPLPYIRKIDIFKAIVLQN
jgi:hypothetical protein